MSRGNVVRVAGAVVVAWVLYAGMFLGRSWSARGLQRCFDTVCAAGVTTALGGVLFLELQTAGGLPALWIEVALTAAAAAIVLLNSWQAFRAARYAISFVRDLLVCLGATGALIAVLMGLAVRLYDLAPFGALLVGILAFFLPVNALAEVVHAGLVARWNHSSGGKRRPHR